MSITKEDLLAIVEFLENREKEKKKDIKPTIFPKVNLPYWTKALCLAEARKYKTLKEFRISGKKAYQFAWKNNFLPEIREFLIVTPPIKSVWNKEKLISEAKKYPTLKELRKNKSLYSLLFRHKIYEEATAHLKKKEPILEDALKIARKCKDRKEFREKYNKCYQWVIAHKHLDEINKIFMKINDIKVEDIPPLWLLDIYFNHNILSYKEYDLLELSNLLNITPSSFATTFNKWEKRLTGLTSNIKDKKEKGEHFKEVASKALDYLQELMPSVYLLSILQKARNITKERVLNTAPVSLGV